MASKELPPESLAALFLDARTHGKWTDRDVDDALLARVWDLARMGPTSANCSPLRIVFVKSPEAKARLKPALLEGNVAKTMKAPVTAIFAHDSRFFEHLPRLFPHTDARAWFDGPGKEEAARVTAFRNGTLQAAYFILAARALGLDCGPMSGFDNAAVNLAFFADGRYKSSFLCSLGYGDPAGLHPRGPRFAFEEACRSA